MWSQLLCDVSLSDIWYDVAWSQLLCDVALSDIWYDVEWSEMLSILGRSNQRLSETKRSRVVYN